MASGLQIGSVVLMIATLVLFVLEMLKWKSNDLIGRRVKILRTCQFIIIESLLVLAYLWHPVFQYKSTIDQLMYWTGVVILGLSVIVIAMLDVREVIKQVTKIHKQAFNDLKEDKKKSEP